MTFHEQVEPILQARCQGCHAPGSIAPFSLLTYQQVAQVADKIVETTANRTMPPWGARTTDTCTPRARFKDDPMLTDAQIATIRAWRDQGKLEGDPAKALPPPGIPRRDLPNPSTEIGPAGVPFVVSGTRDQYRCFVVDPQVTQDTWINAAAVLPGDLRVVHHVIVYADPTGESATKALDAAGSYDCFGSAGLSQQNLLTTWTPGTSPTEYPADMGTLIPAGARLVMQVHYHPAAGQEIADTTKLQLRYTDQPPVWLATPRLIGNLDKAGFGGNPDDGLLKQPDETESQFLIPANATKHVEEMRITIPPVLNGVPVPEERYVATVLAHMHFAGRDMRISLERGSPTAENPAKECLLEVPDWDFNWQLSYSYDLPMEKLPRISPGDVLRLRCEYDNSMGNRFIRDMLAQQSLSAPIDIRLGETTLDEMCLGLFVFIAKR